MRKYFFYMKCCVYICNVINIRTNKTMSKDKKRKVHEPIAKEVLERLKQKHGFTSRFIYASIRGERTSESASRIVEDYKKMKSEINKTLQKL